MIPKTRVLLVEDNPADVGLVEEAFQDGRFHYHLSVAPDGVAAINQLQKGEVDGTLPDLILLDLNLPKKDGREVLAEIKSSDVLREIPVIVLTTSDDEADVHRAYGLHANCYLTKPVDIDDFINKIRSIEQFWFTFVRLPSRRPAPRAR